MDWPTHPEGRLTWVFSGTSDGNQLALNLLNENLNPIVFVATDYGRKTVEGLFDANRIHAGRLGEVELHSLALKRRPSDVVDATHPYSIEVSNTLMKFCRETDIPYVRYERPEVQFEYENLHQVEDVKQAAEQAAQLGNHIFLALGSKNIDPFLKLPSDKKVFVRMLPHPELMQNLIDKGLPPSRIIAVQGPFTLGINRETMSAVGADCMVTKSSGEEGGYPQKVQAAMELQIPVIVIRRPELNYPRVFEDRESLIQFLIRKNEFQK